MKEYSNIYCFIINQNTQKKRLKNVKDILYKLNFHNLIIIEPHKADISTKKKLEQKLKINLNSLTFNQISHFSTYLQILERKDINDMFIFEDDIKPLYTYEYITSKLKKIVNEYPKDSDMIYLEFCNQNCPDFNDNFVRLNNPECTAAIYYPSLNKRYNIIKKILDNIKYISKKTTDDTLKELIEKKIINAYTLKPLFTQDLYNFSSNIPGSATTTHKSCSNFPKGITKNRIFTEDINFPNNPIIPNIKENFELNKTRYKNIIYFIILIFTIFFLIILIILIIKK